MEKFYSFCESSKRHLGKVLILGLMAFVIEAFLFSVHGQAIRVNKVDYLPGDVVTISGHSWQQGENVTVVLTENFLKPEGELITTKSFTCDSQGAFSGTLYTIVEANLGAFFRVKATGSISNHVCTTVFNDAGGDYGIDYSAYDPEFYQRYTIATSPVGLPLTGNLPSSPLALGGADGSTMHTRTVESLNPAYLGLGQIVAYEFYISVSASGLCNNDIIRIGGEWSTVTSNGGNFGFDDQYKVIAAFVDQSPETGFVDGGTPASASIYSNVYDPGSKNISATFDISGLDPGDKIPVEVWLVLKDNITAGVGSNVPSGFENGITLGSCKPGDVVKSGQQTVTLLQAGSFFTSQVDLSINKTDSQDPVSTGSPFSYMLTITNSGPAVANNVVITDILSSSNLVVGTIVYSNDPGNWTFNQTGQTLTFTTLSIGIGETVTITIPVTWTGSYAGTKTSGSAGNGVAGSPTTLTCSGGDLTNKATMTTISDDTNLNNNGYCQPTNVFCTQPNVDAGINKVLNCTITSIGLSGTSTTPGATFAWVASNGGHIASGETTSTPTVDAAGTYTLTVTDPTSGCTATDFALVTLNDAVPNVDAGADKVLTCSVTSIALSGSSSTDGASYLWAGPGIVSGGTSLAPVVNAAGTYTLTVTGLNGCSASASALVTLNDAVPNVDAGADKVLTCSVTSIALSGSSSTDGASYLWAGPGIVSGGTSLAPVVNAAGTYTLTVTGLNGCSASASALVSLNSTVPDVHAGPDKVITCTLAYAVLKGSSSTPGAIFAWVASNGGRINRGADTATPTAVEAGTYTLTVTDPATGCTATDIAIVTVSNILPDVNAGPDRAIACSATYVVLKGSSTIEGATFAWVAGNGGHIITGEDIATPTVDAAGTYTLTVTDPSTGCTNTDLALVTLNNTLPDVSAGPDKVLTCTMDYAVLKGSSTTPGAIFAWIASDGGYLNRGADTATPTAIAAGKYTLTVTDPATGCTATDIALVTLNNTIPDVNAGADKELTCAVNSISLSGSTATENAIYLWTGPGILSGENSPTPVVNAAGTYTLKITGPNGCTASDYTRVTLNNTLPNISAGADKVLTCTVTYVVLKGSSTTAGATFAWVAGNGGHIVTGAGIATPTVDVAGTYTLTVRDPATGCEATDAAIVTLNNGIPDVNAGPDKVIDCIVPTVTLSGSTNTSGVFYSWSASNGGHILSGADTDSPVVDAAGKYTLTITGPNGCTDTDETLVTKEECNLALHCTYTQGFYGNINGKTCDGKTALQLMEKSFVNRSSVVFGTKNQDGTGKYFELMKNSISNTSESFGIFQMLPGGGEPAALIGPARSTDEISKWGNVPRSIKKATYGKIMNNLLSQNIVLFFNLNNDLTLGNVRLEDRYMITQESTDCSSNIPVPNTSTYVEIPQSVLDYFKVNNLQGTVNDLHVLANKVLGGITITPKISASDVSNAVDAINKGFDQCRILSGFSSDIPGFIPMAYSETGETEFAKNETVTNPEFCEVSITVYPNPFATVAKFEIVAIFDSHVTLEIYSHNGSLIKVLCNENLKQGDVRTVEFDATMYPHSSYIYKLMTNTTMRNGVLLKTQ